MSNSDPILRAVAQGDTHTPDGRALARLGTVVRAAAKPPQTVDLLARVMAAVHAESAGASAATEPSTATVDLDMTDDSTEATDAADAAVIDAWYNGDRAAAVAADPLLERLGSLVREAARPPREPDLLPRVVQHIQRQQSSRRQALVLDSVSRWRIWTAVVAGHAAAFIALAAIHVSVGRDTVALSPEMAEARLRERPGYHRIIPSRMVANPLTGSLDQRQLPTQWDELASDPGHLFALRQSSEQKNAARTNFGAQSAGPALLSMDGWLMNQVLPDGRLVASGPDPDARFVARGAVAYALLGEGLSSPERSTLVQSLLARLADDVLLSGEELDARSHGLCLLALVEGSLLLDDKGLRIQTEVLLNRYGHRLSEGVGEGGMGGFGMLAVELAAIGGFALPSGLRSSVERNVARTLPSDVADPGRLGVAAYARQIKGAGHALSTAQQLNQLMSWLPQGGSHQRLDVIAWYFPTMALRESRDRRWTAWNQALERTLLNSLMHDDQGGAWLPGARMRYGDSFGEAADITATAFAMMALQTPYRYLPLGY